MERRTVTIPEAAEVLGVHKLSVRRLIERGELRVVRVGRRVLIPVTEIDRFVTPKEGVSA